MLKLDIWNIVWTIVNILVLYAIFKNFFSACVKKLYRTEKT